MERPPINHCKKQVAWKRSVFRVVREGFTRFKNGPGLNRCNFAPKHSLGGMATENDLSAVQDLKYHLRVKKSSSPEVGLRMAMKQSSRTLHDAKTRGRSASAVQSFEFQVQNSKLTMTTGLPRHFIPRNDHETELLHASWRDINRREKTKKVSGLQDGSLDFRGLLQCSLREHLQRLRMIPLSVRIRQACSIDNPRVLGIVQFLMFSPFF